MIENYIIDVNKDKRLFIKQFMETQYERCICLNLDNLSYKISYDNYIIEYSVEHICTNLQVKILGIYLDLGILLINYCDLIESNTKIHIIDYKMYEQLNFSEDIVFRKDYEKTSIILDVDLPEYISNKVYFDVNYIFDDEYISYVEHNLKLFSIKSYEYVIYCKDFDKHSIKYIMNTFGANQINHNILNNYESINYVLDITSLSGIEVVNTLSFIVENKLCNWNITLRLMDYMKKYIKPNLLAVLYKYFKDIDYYDMKESGRYAKTLSKRKSFG